MEHEQEPERFGIECPGCGGTVEITNETTKLKLDSDNKFRATIRCSSIYDCDPVILEVGPEDMAYYSHLDSYYDQNGNQMHVIEAHESVESIDVSEEDAATMLMHQFRKWLYVYNPQASEFGTRGRW